MGAGELSQLDERLREVAEAMASIQTSLTIVEGTVSLMHKALFQGNGRPALMTRVEMLEQNQTLMATQCKDCRAVILAGSGKKDEQRAMIVIERWKAITAIVTAALASPVIIAVLAALLK